MTKKEIDQNLNEDNMKLQLSRLQHRFEKIKLGGGEKRIAQQHAQGKMSVRERVNYLIDPDTSFLEIGAFAGYDMYPDEGGCPAGGVVVGIGYVRGRQCVIVANDATNADAIWITEVWDSAASHQASLKLPAVQEAISKARPIIAGFGERFETAPVGGVGLPR